VIACLILIPRQSALEIGVKEVFPLGNILIATGRSVGLQILALCCVIFLVWLVFNAWALVIGLADATKGNQPRHGAGQ